MAVPASHHQLRLRGELEEGIHLAPLKALNPLILAHSEHNTLPRPVEGGGVPPGLLLAAAQHLALRRHDHQQRVGATARRVQQLRQRRLRYRAEQESRRLIGF